MKRCFAWTVFATLLGMSSAWAQNGLFDIPFAFHVGNRDLNAGNYELIVGQPFDGYVTLVSRVDTKERAVASFFVDRQMSKSEIGTKLVFKKYGPDEYFLNQVLDARHAAALQLPRSKEELVTSRLVASRAPEFVTPAAERPL